MNEFDPNKQHNIQPNMGKQAATGFLSGFSGCLGVGLAVVVVGFFLLVAAASCAHH